MNFAHLIKKPRVQEHLPLVKTVMLCQDEQDKLLSFGIKTKKHSLYFVLRSFIRNFVPNNVYLGHFIYGKIIYQKIRTYT